MFFKLLMFQCIFIGLYGFVVEGSIASISIIIAPLLVSFIYFVDIVGFDCKSLTKLYHPV